MTVDSEGRNFETLGKIFEKESDDVIFNNILTFWFEHVNCLKEEKYDFETKIKVFKLSIYLFLTIITSRFNDKSKEFAREKIKLFLLIVNNETKSLETEYNLKNNVKENESMISELTGSFIPIDSNSQKQISNSFNTFEKNIESKLTELKTIEPEEIDLALIYSIHKEEYNEWLKLEFSSKRSHTNKIKHKSRSKIIFEKLKIKTTNDFRVYFKRLDKNTSNRDNVSFRNFVSFCGDKGYLKGKEVAVIKSMIPGGVKNKTIDKKRFNEAQIIEFVKNVKEFVASPPKHLRKEITELYTLFVQLSIESGARITSIKYDMFENFDINRLKQYDDISVYELNKEKTNEHDNKLALYLFCRTVTINKILEYYHKGKITPDFYKYFEENIIDWLREQNKNVVLFKYHRKFLKSLCTKNNVVREYSEYICSRTSTLLVGDINYDELDKYSVREYAKILPDLNRILDDE